MANGHDREDQVRAERARAVALFRYSLIREPADPQLTTSSGESRRGTARAPCGTGARSCLARPAVPAGSGPAGCRGWRRREAAACPRTPNRCRHRSRPGSRGRPARPAAPPPTGRCPRGGPTDTRVTTGDPPLLPVPAQLHEAFLWSEHRTVTKTATVNLHGNHYEVDTALIGRRVELVFDPFDLTDIEVRWQHRAMGKAIPHRIGRHVHHKARPDDTTPPPAPTGIDYLHLIEAQHSAELAERLRYSQLGEEQIPGQLALPGTGIDEETSL
jgi:hypothetical protein